MQTTQESNTVAVDNKGMVSIDIDDKKFARIQRYILVFALIVCGYCIAFLFKAYDNLQRDFRAFQTDVITKYSIITQDCTNALRELKTEMREKK